MTTEKEKTLKEIIEWADQGKKAENEMAKFYALAQDVYGVSFHNGVATAYSNVSALCENMLGGYNGTISEDENQAEDTK
jgi:hypothetical protein